MTRDDDIKISGPAPRVIRRDSLIDCLRKLFKERCGLREYQAGLTKYSTTFSAISGQIEGIDFCIDELAGRFGIATEEIEEQP